MQNVKLVGRDPRSRRQNAKYSHGALVKFSVLISLVAQCFCAQEARADIASPLLVAGSGRAYLVDTDEKIIWEQPKCGNIHRVWLKGDWVYYSNGDLRRANILTHADEFVYQPAPKEGVWGFEILENGNIVVADNANDRIVELSSDGKKELVAFKVNARSAKGVMPNAHNHLRMIRKTPAGTYLVCCSVGCMVREYDAAGKLVWEQETPKLAFDCLRLKNGNTLISYLDTVSEFRPDHTIAWTFACKDVPELKVNNLCGLQEMPNGNFVIGTYANGGPTREKVTALEVTRQGKVVWQYKAADKCMMTAFRINAADWPKK